MELTPEQVFLVGLFASILSAVLRFIAARTGKEIGKGWMTVVVAVVSMVLAIIFNLPQLPVYTDPLQYIGEWATLLSAYIGAATAIYNILLAQVLDKLDITVERFLPE